MVGLEDRQQGLPLRLVALGAWLLSRSHEEPPRARQTVVRYLQGEVHSLQGKYRMQEGREDAAADAEAGGAMLATRWKAAWLWRSGWVLLTGKVLGFGHLCFT